MRTRGTYPTRSTSLQDAQISGCVAALAVMEDALLELLPARMRLAHDER
jgi:hypothetical protein